MSTTAHSVGCRCSLIIQGGFSISNFLFSLPHSIKYNDNVRLIERQYIKYPKYVDLNLSLHVGVARDIPMGE
jgi:hypothetical protein